MSLIVAFPPRPRIRKHRGVSGGTLDGMALAVRACFSAPIACGLRLSQANNRRVYVLRDETAFVGVPGTGGGGPQTHLLAFSERADAEQTLREIHEFRDAEGRWPSVSELPGRTKTKKGEEPPEDGGGITQVSLHELDAEDVPLKVLKDYAHARGLAVEVVEKRRAVMSRPRPTYKQYKPYLEKLVQIP
jgi:hypothetical protein